jgi:hypothetical protein
VVWKSKRLLGKNSVLNYFVILVKKKLLSNFNRYNLPVIFVIFNNNGIYGGVDKSTFDELKSSGDPCLK